MTDIHETDIHEFVTTEEAATLAGVTRATIGIWIRRQLLPAVQVPNHLHVAGYTYMVRPEDVRNVQRPKRGAGPAKGKRHRRPIIPAALAESVAVVHSTE